MENYDLCEELRTIFESEVFTTPTIYSMLKGFVEATEMHLEEGGKEYNSLLFTKEKEGIYKIDFEYYSSLKNNRNIGVSGNYQDFEFKLQCFFDNKQIYHKQVIEIPFILELCKQLDNNNYKLLITGQKGETKIIILRQSIDNEFDKENVTFYCHRMDFENILGIIPSFIQNPGYVFETYRNIYATKKVYFNNNEVDDVKFDDTLKIDEKGHLLQKVLK